MSGQTSRVSSVSILCLPAWIAAQSTPLPGPARDSDGDIKRVKAVWVRRDTLGVDSRQRAGRGGARHRGASAARARRRRVDGTDRAWRGWPGAYPPRAAKGGQAPAPPVSCLPTPRATLLPVREGTRALRTARKPRRVAVSSAGLANLPVVARIAGARAIFRAGEQSRTYAISSRRARQNLPPPFLAVRQHLVACKCVRAYKCAYCE